MKKGIQIRVTDSPQWIGGLYYKRNILFSLLQNEKIRNKYKLVVTVCKENVEYFRPFSKDIEIIIVDENSKIGKIVSYILEKFKGIKYVFPAEENKYRNILGVRSIDWIPDFQHNHYPENFSEEEIKKRTERYIRIQHSKEPLILSSNDSLRDFRDFYGEKNNSYVVPFVSFIEPELRQLNSKIEAKILHKFKLNCDNYVCISNQFWKHKNHIVVLKSIKLLAKKYLNFDLQFVFTGVPKDYRNPKYYNSLTELMNDEFVIPHIKMLGFIDRVEQIAIMKNARFIIQPSLFEGWGTVVEDAKVLDKLILLSDIPIHHEQMNENCVLFDPYDPKDLASKIIDMMDMKHEDDINKGINDMYKRASLYSQEFLRILEDVEAGRN